MATKREGFSMKRLTETIIGVFALLFLIVSSAQAITVSKASIKKGVVAVTGKAAAPNSPISWEGVNVATANAKGGFSFSRAVVPADCVGKLSDGTTSMDVVLTNCTPTGAVLETGQTTCYDVAGTIVPCAGTGQDGEVQKG